MADAHTDAAMRICLMTEPWNRTACVSDAATADGEIVNRNESCSVERMPLKWDGQHRSEVTWCTVT